MTSNRPPQEFMDELTAQGLKCRPAMKAARLAGYKFNYDWFRKAYTKPEKAAEPDLPLAGGTVHAPDAVRPRADAGVYVFTAQQNNTHLHDKFWDSLQMLMKHRSATLMVSRFGYNKKGWQKTTKDDHGLWYDGRLDPYVVNQSIQVAPDLVWCGELDILPTASKPPSGLQNYTRSASSIVPHVKVQMESVATMKYEPAKMVYTTGAITQRNYIQKKTGQVAEFHHVFGALLVEVRDDGIWFARQIIASNDGSFYDLGTRYTPDGWEEGLPVDSITWGDVHAEKLDQRLAMASWSSGGMLHELKPAHQFIHDLTDFQARNHHNIKDPHFLAEMRTNKSESVQDDMCTAAMWLSALSRVGTETCVVQSNHDEAVGRWLKDHTAACDPVNAGYWHQLNSAWYRAISKGRDFYPFEYAIKQFGCKMTDVKFLRLDESKTTCEGQVEHNMHGHNGKNGARGSANAYRSAGRKFNIGHSHSACIIDGVYQCGNMLDQAKATYAKGLSSWSPTHIVTYPNGKRTLITLKETAPNHFDWRMT